MAALQAAGSSLVGARSSGFGPKFGNTLGVRSLREDYAKPVNRPSAALNLKVLGEHLAGVEGVCSEERSEALRFQHLFKGDELFPAGVFLMALELGPHEVLNGRPMPYDEAVLMLRDNLIASYKPLVAKIRQLHAKEIDRLPNKLVLSFAQAWKVWEAAWLRNREDHAVEALQPLAKAILSLEPLLISVEKERLLPWPRVKHQKAITVKCLEGFVHSFSELTATVLPSLRRELDPDPRLFLLMDHVLMLRGDRSLNSCLQGLASTPEVNFPNYQGGAPHKDATSVETQTAASTRGQSVQLDQYAFKLLGASVGDSVAAGKVHVLPGRPPVDAVPSEQAPTGVMPGAPGVPRLELKDTDLNKKAASHALELLHAFESVKDMLLSLKSTLHYIDPALDQDEVFVAQLQRLERAFQKSKRHFLEPTNLA